MKADCWWGSASGRSHGRKRARQSMNSHDISARRLDLAGEALENSCFPRTSQTWAEGEKLAICPITELGFVRISTQPAFGASVADARKMLDSFYQNFGPKFI